MQYGLPGQLGQAKERAMRTCAGAAAQDSDGLAADGALVRWGVAAAVTAMLAWLIAVALIPPDAKLDQGDQHLVQVLRAHTGQLYAAALLAAFAAVLTRLVPEGSPGWGLLRVPLAGCLITHAMVATGASSGLAGLHAAAGNAGTRLAALGWRGLWLTYLAAAVPTIVFTVTGVLALRQAGLSPPWVSALGWLPAAAHVLVLCTLAQRGPFAPDGIIAGLVPLTTVIWILALAATLPRSRQAAVTAASGTGG
jgi:hypothetical protein